MGTWVPDTQAIGRPTIDYFFFHIDEYHLASRTGGSPLCLPCCYGFRAVLAFSHTSLYRHGITAVLAFSHTGLIPLVLVIH